MPFIPSPMSTSADSLELDGREETLHRRVVLDVDGALVGFAKESLAVAADPQRLDGYSRVLEFHGVHYRL